VPQADPRLPPEPSLVRREINPGGSNVQFGDIHENLRRDILLILQDVGCFPGSGADSSVTEFGRQQGSGPADPRP
jgi:hypothetical protein